MSEEKNLTPKHLTHEERDEIIKDILNAPGKYDQDEVTRRILATKVTPKKSLEDIKINDKGDIDLMTPDEMKKYINDALKDSLECYLINSKDPEALAHKIQFKFPKTTLGFITVDIDLNPPTRWQRVKKWFKKDPIDNSMKLGLTVIGTLIVVYGLYVGIEQYGWFGG